MTSLRCWIPYWIPNSVLDSINLLFGCLHPHKCCQDQKKGENKVRGVSDRCGTAIHITIVDAVELLAVKKVVISDAVLAVDTEGKAFQICAAGLWIPSVPFTSPEAINED